MSSASKTPPVSPSSLRRFFPRLRRSRKAGVGTCIDDSPISPTFEDVATDLPSPISHTPQGLPSPPFEYHQPAVNLSYSNDRTVIAQAPRTSYRALETLGLALADLETVLYVFPLLRSVIAGLRVCMTLDRLYVAEMNEDEYENLVVNLTTISQDISSHIVQLNQASVSQLIQDFTKYLRQSLIKFKLRRERRQTNTTESREPFVDWEITHYQGILSLVSQFRLDIQNIYTSTRKRLMDPIATHQWETPAYNAFYNAVLPTKIHRRACAPNTCLGILETTKAWATKADGPNVLWITGMTGAGKTTIAYTVCSQFDDEKLLGASFFCSGTFADCRSTNRIIPTIAYQLAQFSNLYWDVLSRTLKEPNIALSDISSQFDKLLVEPLLRAKDEIPKNAIVVIDALDECIGVGDIREIVQSLSQSRDELPIKFLFTSRFGALVTLGLGSFSDDTFIQLYNIDQLHAQPDIYLYLDRLLSPTIPLRNIDELVRLAGGQFIFAATTARYLRPEHESIDSIHRLLTILENPVISNNGNNAKLDSLYMAILSNAFDNKDPPELICSQLVLWTITYARELMTVAAIVELLGLVTRGDVIHSIQPLWSVLHLSSTTGVMSLRHSSFREFLLDPNRSGGHYYSEAEYSECIAFRYFLVMEKSLRFNICDLETSTKLDTDVPDLDCRIARAIPPVLSNACRHWSEHLEKAGPSSRIVEHLDDFLRQRLLFWMEVLNLKGWIDKGEAMLVQAHDWVLRSDMPWPINLELQGLIQDAFKFIRCYSTSPASKSTPHIYISALPSTQRESHIYRTYWPRTHGLFLPIYTQNTRLRSSAITSSALSPDNTRVASGSQDGTICVWDISKGSQLLELPSSHSNSQPITSLGFSPNGAQLVSGSQDGIMCVWDIYKGFQFLKTIVSHGQPIVSITVSPDGTRVASGSQDGTICVWDIPGKAQVFKAVLSHSQPVTSIAFAPDGTIHTQNEYVGLTPIWRHPRHNYGNPIGSVGVSLDDNEDAFESRGNIIQTYDYILPNDAIKTDYPGNALYITFTKDKNLLRILRDIGDSAATPKLRENSNSTHYAISPDRKMGAFGSSNGEILLWNRISSTILFGPFQAHDGIVSLVAFSSGGQYVISGSDDCTIRFWDVCGLDNRQSGRTWRETTVITNSWKFKVDEMGWVKDSESRLVLWLSPDDIKGMWGSLFESNAPPCSYLISTEDSFVGLRKIAHREPWGECYSDPTRSI